MAGFKRTPEPQFFVSDENKEAMVGQYVAQTIFAIERLGNTPDAPLADDFLDIVARAAAVMLAADTNLSTPGKRRLGAEAVATHVLRHLNRYSAEQAETGTPVLHRMLAENEIPPEMRKTWNNS